VVEYAPPITRIILLFQVIKYSSSWGDQESIFGCTSEICEVEQEKETKIVRLK